MKKTAYIALLLISLGMIVACGGRKTAETKEQDTESMCTDTFDIQPEPVQQTPQHVDNYHGIIPASVDTMLMVIDRQGEVLGRWGSTNASTYTVVVQDDVEIPKIGNKIVTFRAKDGKGVLYTKRTHVNIRQQPDLNSTVICQISNDKNCIPETYPCLGKTDEWYKINVHGKIGYVRHDLVEWDGMDTF